MTRRAVLTLDALPGRYEGWTLGLDWNGFACPLFEEEEVRRIVRDLNAGGEARAALDESTGIVSVEDDDHPGEPERFGPESAALDGRTVRVWGVGTMAWTWREQGRGGSPSGLSQEWASDGLVQGLVLIGALSAFLRFLPGGAP